MKKSILFLFIFHSTIKVFVFSQTIVTDPGLYGVLISNNQVHKSSLNGIKKEQNQIKVLKTKIAGLTANINRIQSKVEKSLTDVKSFIRDGHNVSNAWVIATDITEYQSKAFTIAKRDPSLVLIAHKMELKLSERKLALGAFIVNALKGGEGNMMTNMDRMKIINRVVDELKVMRGIAYGIWIRMKYARYGNKWKEIALAHKIDLFWLNEIERSTIVRDLKVW